MILGGEGRPQEFEVERGNTQDGVNQKVLSLLPNNSNLKLLDFPCGQGAFLRAVQKKYPKGLFKGSDPFAEPYPEIKNIFYQKMSHDWSFLEGEKLDAITCISGVMCFDRISDYFLMAHSHLNSGGLLIVTNDNVITLRDRLSFLFFGRVKRFKKFFCMHEGNWNLVLIQALWKQFRINGFELASVHYTTRRFTDYFFFPHAHSLLWSSC